MCWVGWPVKASSLVYFQQVMVYVGTLAPPACLHPTFSTFSAYYQPRVFPKLVTMLGLSGPWPSSCTYNTQNNLHSQANYVYVCKIYKWQASTAHLILFQNVLITSYLHLQNNHTNSVSPTHKFKWRPVAFASVNVSRAVTLTHHVISSKYLACHHT